MPAKDPASPPKKKALKAPKAPAVDESVEPDHAPQNWMIFLRHYWPSVLFAAAFPIFCLIALVGSYIDPGIPASIFPFYVIIGAARVFLMGNGIPVPYVSFLDETYSATFHKYNSLTGNIETETVHDPSRKDLDKMLQNVAYNLALQIACKIVLLGIWGPLDLIVQGAHLVHAVGEFQRGNLSDYRVLRWKQAGVPMLIMAAILTGVSCFALDRTIRKPEVRTEAQKADLETAFAPGRTYIGSWEGHPEAGELGLRIETLAPRDEHQGRDLTATVFDVTNPQRTKAYVGRIYFLATAQDVAVEPKEIGEIVNAAPNRDLYLETKYMAPLPLMPRPDGTLYCTAGDIPIIFRPQ